MICSQRVFPGFSSFSSSFLSSVSASASASIPVRRCIRPARRDTIRIRLNQMRMKRTETTFRPTTSRRIKTAAKFALKKTQFHVSLNFRSPSSFGLRSLFVRHPRIQHKLADTHHTHEKSVGVATFGFARMLISLSYATLCAKTIQSHPLHLLSVYLSLRLCVCWPYVSSLQFITLLNQRLVRFIDSVKKRKKKRIKIELKMMRKMRIRSNIFCLRNNRRTTSNGNDVSLMTSASYCAFWFIHSSSSAFLMKYFRHACSSQRAQKWK